MNKSLKVISFLMCIILICSFSPRKSFCAHSAVNSNLNPEKVSDVVGVFHGSGKYHFTDKDYLNEGADEIENIGTSVIKLWFKNRAHENYYYNSDWEQFGELKSLSELAETSYFKNVFSRPQFKTIILNAYEFSNGYDTNWRNGLSETEKSNVYNEFYNFTMYLYTVYQGSGKTFILQNWESDSALDLLDASTQLPNSYTVEEQNLRIQGMTDWLNTRQEAITAARTDALREGIEGVTVAGAAEVVYIPILKSYPVPTAIEAIMPNTNMDLYSFSNWKTTRLNTASSFFEHMDYIKQYCPDSPLFGSKNIYFGEMGVFEMVSLLKNADNYTPESDAEMRMIMQQNIRYALEWGVRYVIYWQIFCNGLRPEVEHLPGVDYAVNQLKGVWLRRPDGSYTGTYNYFKSIMPLNIESYKGVCEAEACEKLSSDGRAVTTYQLNHASGGYLDNLNASAVGNFVKYKVDIPTMRQYDIKVGVKKSPAKGKFQLYIQNNQAGGEIDCFSPSDIYEEVHITTADFANTGSYDFEFMVSGKNESSADYDLSIDYIKLVPVLSDVEKDLAALTIGYAQSENAMFVGSDLHLPALGENGSTISWTSSDENIVSAGGNITRSITGDKYAVMTATVEKGDESRQKTFAINVMGDYTRAAEADKDALGLILRAGDIGNRVTQDIGLISSGSYGSKISWTSSNKAIVSDNGVISRNLHNNGDKRAFLKAAISNNGIYAEKVFEIIVKPCVLDPLDNWNMIFSQTTGWLFSTTNPEKYFDDTSRAARKTLSAESIVYNYNSIYSFTAVVFSTTSNVDEQVLAYTSPDNQVWTELALENSGYEKQSEGWHRASFYPSSAMPEGTNYLKLELLNTGYTYTPQIGEVALFHTPFYDAQLIDSDGTPLQGLRNGAVRVCVKVDNPSNADSNITVIAALYNKNTNILAKIVASEHIVSKGDKSVDLVSLPLIVTDAQNQRIKLMFWNNLKDAHPLTSSIDFTEFIAEK
ncbi:MAG: hypothetical protein M0R40_06515 [Firmicutes bacterium]|nr:hypothetical protein [Bacillota bacterium]